MNTDAAMRVGTAGAFVEPERRGRGAKTLWRVLAYLVVTLGAVIMVVPFLWMASTAFKSGGSAFDYPPTWIPRPFTLENFKEVWTAVDFSRYFFNSLFIAVCVTAGEVLTSALAAYAFARLRFPLASPPQYS